MPDVPLHAFVVDPGPGPTGPRTKHNLFVHIFRLMALRAIYQVSLAIHVLISLEAGIVGRDALRVYELAKHCRVSVFGISLSSLELIDPHILTVFGRVVAGIDRPF